MSGTHGVFQHRPGYFFTILEEDLCEVYKKDGVHDVCRAYITSILAHLTNKQYESTGSDGDIWVYMSLPEMARRMRHACSERTIHKEIQGMSKDGYLSKRRATGKATMEYKLSLKRIRKALEALPDKQSCNSARTNLAIPQEPSCNSARITLQNSKVILAELQARVPREKPLEKTENKGEGDANASTPTRNDLIEEVEKSLSDPRIAATTVGMLRSESENELDPEKTRTPFDRHPRYTDTQEQFRAHSSSGAVTQDKRQFKTPAPRLTERGAAVRAWMETIAESALSETAGNIRACNRLGANPDVSFDSLKRTIEMVQAIKFVIDHDIAVDVQLLASDESRLNFEKNWPTARRKQRAGPQATPESDTHTPEPEGYYPDYGDFEDQVADFLQREEARKHAAQEREHQRDRAF